MKASKLLNPTRPLAVEVTFFEDGIAKTETLNITHRVITPEMWAKIKAKPDADEADAAESENTSDGDHERPAKKQAAPTADDILKKDGLVDEVLSFLITWDVVDEAGETLPITRQTLTQMDYHVLKAISNAVYKHTFPNWTT